MQKRLVRVGDSLALIIDKSILSVLNINRMTRLKVLHDGYRLVVEPLIGNGDPARRPRARRWSCSGSSSGSG
jgi:antitoxin component of MazEF toxin-antitoxin module